MKKDAVERQKAVEKKLDREFIRLNFRINLLVLNLLEFIRIAT